MKRLRKYKHLKKLNKYLLGEKSKSMPLFNSLVKSRTEGLNLDIGNSFFSPRNPLRTMYALKTLYMRYRTVFDYLDIHKPKSILEVGCGIGLGSWILSDLTDNIIAVDYNFNEIAIARRLFPEVKFVVADAYKYIEQIGQEKFDVIICASGPIIDYSLAKKMCNKYILVNKAPALKLEMQKRDMTVAEKRKMVILGRHRLKGIHLSFNTTIVSEEQKGFSPIYFYYYFTYEYLNFFKRMLRKVKVVIW
jgi:phospholipid N-methyltransferase